MPSVTAYYILCGGLLAATGLSTALSTALSAQDPAMLAADGAFVRAANTSDKSALHELLDRDFTWTDFQGKTLSDIPVDAPRAGEPGELKQFTYGELGDVQENLGRMHVLRVWVKRGGGWKIIVYQEVMSRDTPPSFAPGAGKDCENPCKMVPYQAKNATEQQVVTAYSKLETAAMAHNSAVFATLVADEFVAASSNSNKLYDKRGRMEDFDHSKNGGVAPTPLVAASMFDFGDAVLMRSEHKPDRGRPLHVTRVWVKRHGSWMESLSYQTSVVEEKDVKWAHGKSKRISACRTGSILFAHRDTGDRASGARSGAARFLLQGDL